MIPCKPHFAKNSLVAMGREFFVYVYLFILRDSGGGAERERERERERENSKQSLHCEHRARCGALTHEP